MVWLTTVAYITAFAGLAFADFVEVVIPSDCDHVIIWCEKYWLGQLLKFLLDNNRLVEFLLVYTVQDTMQEDKTWI